VCIMFLSVYYVSSEIHKVAVMSARQLQTDHLIPKRNILVFNNNMLLNI